jgi:hypothetical protein
MRTNTLLRERDNVSHNGIHIRSFGMYVFYYYEFDSFGSSMIMFSLSLIPSSIFYHN